MEVLKNIWIGEVNMTLYNILYFVFIGICIIIVIFSCLKIKSILNKNQEKTLVVISPEIKKYLTIVSITVIITTLSSILMIILKKL